MFFPDLQTTLRTIIIGISAYFSLILLLRVSGKRTLSKLNAFDLVVTVAMGSTLASVLTSNTVTWFQGTVAFFILIGLQYAIAKLAVKVKPFNTLIKSKPQVLYVNGEFMKEQMNKERVLKKEILQAARSQGMSSMKQIDTVVLESDGSLSIIKQSDQKVKDTLNEVDGYPKSET